MFQPPPTSMLHHHGDRHRETSRHPIAMGRHQLATSYPLSIDWFKGKSTANHGFYVFTTKYIYIQGFPVNFPLNQFYDSGKDTKNYKKIGWVNQRTQWPCSISQTVSHYQRVSSSIKHQPCIITNQ